MIAGPSLHTQTLGNSLTTMEEKTSVGEDLCMHRRYGIQSRCSVCQVVQRWRVP